MHSLLVLGVAGGKRMRGLQDAAQRHGDVVLHCVDYADAMRDPTALHAMAATGMALKIDSPGDDAWVQHQLCLRGWEAGSGMAEKPMPDNVVSGGKGSDDITHDCTAASPTISTTVLPPKPVAKGELMPTRDWYAGFAQFLRAIPQTAAPLSPVEDILLMTDKLNCQQHLRSHGVAIPPLLGAVSGYGHLLALLDQAGVDNAFIKPRYGSSAAGVVAYRRNRRGNELAVSTVHSANGQHFNAKRMRRYTNTQEIAALIDTLAADQAYAEAWIPKPRTQGGGYDFRVVTLDGEPQHRVARVNNAPMTNLHLDAQRAQAEDLLNDVALQALVDTARAAARTFPRSRMMGLDIVVRGERAWVLEANAFGDLLPRLHWQGRDTYDAQLHALFPKHVQRNQDQQIPAPQHPILPVAPSQVQPRPTPAASS
ncbi:hypothetical protein FXN63_09470 [Pigmentiphaga aceris]|uniref:ATP-grasp domain-containing protein n=1 Tax=Pigmentiphaga aceris TaxID=1940612 RepID=A0A5C0AYW2_9BURK|nr:STM4014 family protein [Pigmentiphaga aceris]QEI06040.1 hypothetical protein FXN63_09470 [Pigmentiphaga aceris]